MAGHKHDRTSEDIHRELTDIFRKLKDPRVSGKMVSIVRVDLAGDLSYCTVYISTLEGMEKSKEVCEGLKSAEGYIRRELYSRLSLRRVPEFTFKPTDSIEYSANISRILHELGEE
jgi:ribosome-binding factor A